MKQTKLQDFPELKDYCDRLENIQLKLEKSFYSLWGGEGSYFFLSEQDLLRKIENHHLQTTLIGW